MLKRDRANLPVDDLGLHNTLLRELLNICHSITFSILSGDTGLRWSCVALLAAIPRESHLCAVFGVTAHTKLSQQVRATKCRRAQDGL